MSTILKALRRLEQEKAAISEQRPLREEVAHYQTQAPAPRRSWLPAFVALGAGLAVGLAVFAWVSLRGDESAPAVATASPEPSAPVVTQRLAGPLADEGPPEQAFSSPVEVVRRPEALPRISDPSPVVPVEAPKAGQRRPVEDSSAARRARQALADSAAVGNMPAELREIIEAQHRKAAESARAVESTPVRVAELSPAPAEPRPAPVRRQAAAPPAPKPEPVERAPKPEPAAPEPKPVQKAAPKAEPRPTPKPAPVVARSDEATPKPAVARSHEATSASPPLPTLYVEKTLWHPQPDRRRAWLRFEADEDARLVVEGDVVSGLLVSEIKPSGIVFERDGSRIQRGLGSPGKRP